MTTPCNRVIVCPPLEAHRAARRVLRALATLFIVALAAMGAFGSGVPERPLATAFATPNHDAFPLVAADSAAWVRIPLDELADHLAHFYTFMVDDRPVEFFAVWTDDNVVRTAYNACDVCFRAKLGYREDGAFMVCSNCGSRFPADRIGRVSGGCNPAPLRSMVDGSDLAIAAADLAVGVAYFP